MPDWQVTATTVRCDTAGDEVTLLVYKDWSVRCTGSRRATGKHGPECTGAACPLALEYRRKLRAEETDQTDSHQ
jgi:hypothetical protein